MIEQQPKTVDPQDPSDVQRIFEGDALLQIFRAAVREEVAAHLAAGHPVFSCGLGDEAGKLFMRMPDRRRFEICPHTDGSYDILREADPDTLS